MKLKILLTGGAGYIGSILVHDLLNQEYNSVIIEEKLIKYRVHKESISSRHDDKSFRKYLIGITLLFYEKKIGILNLVFSIFIGLVKVILRNIRII